MICPTCKRELKVKLKKYQMCNCKCGAKLMLIETNKKLILVDLKNDEGEK